MPGIGTILGILLIVVVIVVGVRLFTTRGRRYLCDRCRLNEPGRCTVPGRPYVHQCRCFRPSVERSGLRVVEGSERDP